jgi:nucleosome binding factor SPN SPT16 subunit
VSFQRFMLGYEFPDTIMVLSVATRTFYVHATAKKCEFLLSITFQFKCLTFTTSSFSNKFISNLLSFRYTVSYLQPAVDQVSKTGYSLVLLNREKGDLNKPIMDSFLTQLRSSLSKVEDKYLLGVFQQDPLVGPAAESWQLDLTRFEISTVDVTRGIESYWLIRDQDALEQIRQAGAFTARVLKYAIIPEMERAVDEEDSKVTPASIASFGEMALNEPKKFPQMKLSPPEAYDFLVPVVVQSTGTCTNSLSTQTPIQFMSNPLRGDLTSISTLPFIPDVVVVSTSGKFREHSAYVARTYLFNPTPYQSTLYENLQKIHSNLLLKCKPGVKVSDLAEQTRNEIVAIPNLIMDSKIAKNFGTSFGLRINEKVLQISSKAGSDAVLEPGMVLQVTLSLADIPLNDVAGNPDVLSSPMGKVQKYTIVLADTVIVCPPSSEEPEVVTSKVASAKDDVVYNISTGEDEDQEEEAPSDRGRRGTVPSGVEGRVGGRSARLAAKGDSSKDEEARKKREEHQKLLFSRQKEEAIRRIENEEGGEETTVRENTAMEVANAPELECFRRSAEYPKGVKSTNVVVDKEHNAVLIPMFGLLVPFHISTIKSVSKTEEGHKFFLRFNFFSSNAALGKDVSPSMQAAVARFPDLMYLRTLNLMSKSGRNFAAAEQAIKALQKKIRADREQAKQASGLVEQPNLILSKDGKIPRLSDLNMWPAMSGRKTQGTLEAHSNGLRFVSSKGEKIELIYSNIKHAIFQPCKDEHIVLIHFHLRQPIVVNKKKAKDIQFFTDVVASSMALDGKTSAHGYDVDELGEEERERQLRVELNKAFKRFVERVEEISEKDTSSNKSSTLAFEVPQREMGFAGTPFKEMTKILPCADCLVAVVDKPPFVASVSSIEHIHFERVMFSSKNFDMVIIYKPGTREKGEDEFIRISAIPMNTLDTIKQWCDEIAELTFTESTTTYQWKTIIDEVVRQDDFYLDTDPDTGEAKPAGWSFLTDAGWGEGEEDEEDVSSSDYSSDEDSSEEDYESDSDISLVDEDEDESDFDEDDLSEEGEDWDEMEKKAEKSDMKRKRGKEDSDEDERGAKRSKGKGKK